MCLTKNKRNFDGLSTIVVYVQVLDPKVRMSIYHVVNQLNSNPMTP